MILKKNSRGNLKGTNWHNNVKPCIEITRYLSVNRVCFVNRPSVTFITPALVIERHSARGRTRERPQESATSCHYTGSVRGQPRSNIAISACDGLVSWSWLKLPLSYYFSVSNRVHCDCTIMIDFPPEIYTLECNNKQLSIKLIRYNYQLWL